MSATPTRDKITQLFIDFGKRGNGIYIPRPYIDFCEGDILAALLLSQLLYWSDRVTDPDGWIAKSYAEWYEETGMTEYQVKRAINGDKRRKHKEFSLESIGLETELRRSPFHKGAATVHYRIDSEKLSKSVNEFLNTRPDSKLSIPVPDIVQNGDHDNVKNDVPDIAQNESPTMSGTFTETTQRTNTKDVAVVVPISTSQENEATEIKSETPLNDDVIEQVFPAEKTRRELIAEYGETRVRAVCERALRDKSVRNPGGWVRNSLEGLWDQVKYKARKSDEDDTQRFLNSKHIAFFETGLDDNDATLPLPQVSGGVVNAVDPSDLPQPDAPPDIARAWNTALNQLRSQYPGNVTKLLEGAVFSQSGQGEYVLTLDNLAARDKLLRYERNIHNVVAGALECKQADITLRLEAQEARPGITVLPKAEKTEAEREAS